MDINTIVSLSYPLSSFASPTCFFLFPIFNPTPSNHFSYLLQYSRFSPIHTQENQLQRTSNIINLTGSKNKENDA
uniref:Uncharacterized protein n=1 Tax=Lotus japonicus TaxID=34305 RepID=I3T7Q7_LOTJA|nr:unknown [Lotus japonicus]